MPGRARSSRAESALEVERMVRDAVGATEIARLSFPNPANAAAA